MYEVEGRCNRVPIEWRSEKEVNSKAGKSSQGRRDELRYSC